MNLVKTFSFWLLLGGFIALTMSDKVASAQTRQDGATDTVKIPVEWQQRVLKKPQPQSQWHAVGQSADDEQASPQEQPAQPIRQQTQIKQTQYTEQTTEAEKVWQDPQPRQAASPKKTAHAYKAARRPVADRNVFSTGTMPRGAGVPGRQRVALTAGQEVIDAGDIQYESAAQEGTFADVGGAGCDSCGGGADCGDSCGAPCGETCGETCDFGWEAFDGRCGPWLRGLSFFAGADGFKGPGDRGKNGNFGLNEGLNLARPLGDPWGCGYQIGANFVQSDFSGTQNITVADHELHAAARKQYFVTAGLFRRADSCGGFQGGVAYDYLYDMYYENSSLQQIRSETSYVCNSQYEIGYYGVYGVASDRVIDGRLDPTDMFVCFIRRNFENGGDGRLWGGATGSGDGLIGVDLWIPLGRGFALENRVNYLIPKSCTSPDAQTRESWGLVAQLVWYPGQNAKCQQQNPYRPIFNVADNSLFMVDRLAR